MRKSWLPCVLLGTLAWGQAAPQAPPAGNEMKPPAPAAPVDTSASVPPDAPVITVNGVCAPTPKTTAAKGTAAKSAAGAKSAAAAKTAADCKTVITKAEFEKLASSLAPNVTPQLKRQLSGVLPRLIAMSAEAKKQGLDKTEQFKETVKYAQMQILTNQLQRKVQEEASKVTDEQIEAYYKENTPTFEQYNVDRLFIPRTKQAEPEAKDDDKDEKLSEEAQKAKEAAEKAKADANEQAMTKLADDLRTRAAAGEDFIKLQKEAFDAAGMKIESPTVNLPNVRRTGLPPGHAAVFDLKQGEISQVISDSGGHYVYKMNSKTEMSLDQAKGEIHSKLQNDSMKKKMDDLNGSFKAETNEAYFGPAGANQGAPPPRMRPRPPMPNAGPMAQPQGQPPVQPQSQAPAPPPATKPN